MSTVSFKEFERLDMRVVKVVDVERIPGMTKILKLKVDIGGEYRDMVAGGAQYYPPEYFKGRLLIALVNIEPKRVASVESKGMLLAADHQGKPFWLSVEGEVPVGTKVR